MFLSGERDLLDLKLCALAYFRLMESAKSILQLDL